MWKRVVLWCLRKIARLLTSMSTLIVLTLKMYFSPCGKCRNTKSLTLCVYLWKSCCCILWPFLQWSFHCKCIHSSQHLWSNYDCAKLLNFLNIFKWKFDYRPSLSTLTLSTTLLVFQYVSEEHINSFLKNILIITIEYVKVKWICFYCALGLITVLYKR